MLELLIATSFIVIFMMITAGLITMYEQAHNARSVFGGALVSALALISVAAIVFLIWRVTT